MGSVDKAGAERPRDLVLRGSDGREFALGEFMDDERPLVVVLAYYECPMLCSLVLNGSLDVLKKLGAGEGGAEPRLPGKDYRFLVVSFDPRDSTEVAGQKRASYVEAFGEATGTTAPGPESFEFATGSEQEVARLSDLLGFRYRWDESEQQYAHAAGMFVVSPAGKLTGTLTGITFDASDVRTALADAARGHARTPLKSVLLYCFQYNPKTGKYVLAAGRAMRVGAAVTIAGVVVMLLWLSRGRRRRGEDDEQSARNTTGLV